MTSGEDWLTVSPEMEQAVMAEAISNSRQILQEKSDIDLVKPMTFNSEKLKNGQGEFTQMKEVEVDGQTAGGSLSEDELNREELKLYKLVVWLLTSIVVLIGLFIAGLVITFCWWGIMEIISRSP